MNPFQLLKEKMEFLPLLRAPSFHKKTPSYPIPGAMFISFFYFWFNAIVIIGAFIGILIYCIFIGNGKISKPPIKTTTRDALTNEEIEQIDEWLALAIASFQIDHFTGVIHYYSKILWLDPQNTKALIGMGSLYFKTGDPRGAIKYYDRILKIDPQNSYALIDKGISLKKLKMYQEAIDCFDKALKIDPNDEYVLDHREKARLFLNGSFKE